MAKELERERNKAGFSGKPAKYVLTGEDIRLAQAKRISRDAKAVLEKYKEEAETIKKRQTPKPARLGQRGLDALEGIILAARGDSKRLKANLSHFAKMYGITPKEADELDGPKLMLVFRDPFDRMKNDLKIREYDTLTVSLCDTWHENAVNEKEVFTILTCNAKADGLVKLNLMAKTVYGMKEIADKTKVFTQKGFSEIIKSFANGAKLNLGKFPVVENYHCIAGSRPASLLRQIADEQGAHIWYARGKVHMKRFAELIAQSPALTFHYGTLNNENSILRYSKPSGQMAAQEGSIRTFTGWNETDGRVKTSLDLPVLSKAGSKPVTITGSPNTFILGNAPIAKKTVIDFIAAGNLSVTAGQMLKLVWHTADPANPLNEGLPDKVAAEKVAHWYSSQKYYCRIKGAAALEPF